MFPRTLLLLLLAAFPLAAATPLAPVELDLAAGLQTQPAIASDGSRYFMVWRDARPFGPVTSANSTLFASAVDENGALMTPQGVPVTSNFNYVSAFDVVSTDSEYVVIWAENFTTVHARRFERDGKPIDAQPVVISRNLPVLSDIRVATNGQTIALWSGTGLGGAIEIFARNDLSRIAIVPVTSLGLASSAKVLASDGNDYLVGAAANALPLRTDNLLVGRLSGSGDVLRAPILAASVSGGNQLMPSSTRTIWTGDEYLVVSSVGNSGVIGMRFTADGDPIGTQFAIDGAASATPINVASAADGSAVVVYERNSNTANSDEIVAVRVIDGVVGTPAVIASTSREEGSPAIASNGRAYVAAWAANESLATVGGIETAPIGLDAGRLDGVNPQTLTPENTLSARAQRELSSDGTLIVWSEESGDARGRVVARLGSRIFPVAAANVDQRAPATATDGEVHFVVWIENQTDVVGMRFDATGTPLDPAPFAIGRALYSRTQSLAENSDAAPAVTWTGRYYLVAFTAPNLQLRLARVTPGGIALDSGGTPVALQRRFPQSKPSFAGSADSTFLVWQEGSAPVQCAILCAPPPPGIVRAMRLDTFGTPLDAAPIEIAPHDFSLNPDAAWNGLWLGVTWTRGNQVFAQRFDRTGRAFDGMPILIGDANVVAEPSIVANGLDFVIAWEAGGSEPFSSIALATLEEGAVNTPVRFDTFAQRPHLFRDSTGDVFAVWESLTVAAAPNVPRAVYENVAEATPGRRRPSVH